MPTTILHKSSSALASLGSDPYRLELKSAPFSPFHYGHSPHSRIAFPRIWGFLLLVAILYAGFNRYDIPTRELQLRASVWFSEYRSTLNQKVTPPLDPKVTLIADAEIFYMLPSKNSDLKGLLLFFHACSQSGQDLFKLPEDRIMVVAALRRGLAVVSITSPDRETGCWSVDNVNQVLRQRVIESFLQHVNLPHMLPRVGMATASGSSTLLSALAQLNLKSIALYTIPDELIARQLAEGATESALPPIAFVHMARDKGVWRSINKQVFKLKLLGVPHEVFQVRPVPFTSQLCDRRLPEIGDRRCALFLQRVHDHYPGLLDKDNYVLKPYSSGDWKTAFEDSKLDDDLRHYIGAPPTPKGQSSPFHFSGHSWAWASMTEEIEVSYGEHDMTCQHRNQVLDFLMKHAGIESSESEKGSNGRRRGLLGILAHQRSSK